MMACKCIGQLPIQVLPVDENCSAILPDYREQITVRDNCVVTSIIQSPLPGTIMDADNPYVLVTIVATDVSNNSSSINFDVVIADDEPPIIIPDSTLLVIHPPIDSTDWNYDSIFGGKNLLTITDSDMNQTGVFIDPDQVVISGDSSILKELGFYKKAKLDSADIIPTVLTIDAGKGDDWYTQRKGTVNYEYLRSGGLNQMYKSERWGIFDYSIPVGSGKFSVELHFAELVYTQPGERVFHVNLEGVRVITSLDLVAAVGVYTPLVRTYTTTVVDDWLDIDFPEATYGNAVVSGIVITKTGELASK